MPPLKVRKNRAQPPLAEAQRMASSWCPPSPLYCWRSRAMPSTHVSWALLQTVLIEASKSRCKRRLGAANSGRLRPVEHPPPHAYLADDHRPAGVADVELQPAERLEIEALETVDALAADEP